MFEKFCKKVLLFIYNVSNQPVKLDKLLEANLLYSEGMFIDGSKLGFRLQLAKAYLVFFLLIHIFIIPIGTIFHEAIKHLDCHLAIMLAIIFTAFLFGLFSIFKQRTADKIAKLRIKQMWKNHFPHFPYDEYSQSINKIYTKAIDENIKPAELERYILDNLTL